MTKLTWIKPMGSYPTDDPRIFTSRNIQEVNAAAISRWYYAIGGGYTEIDGEKTFEEAISIANRVRIVLAEPNAERKMKEESDRVYNQLVKVLDLIEQKESGQVLKDEQKESKGE